MVIRWVYVATFVVVTLITVSCQQNKTQFKTNNGNVENLCPCLPRSICPRVFGTKPEDAKYLGDLTKCESEDEVRCCGASSSFVVGMEKDKLTDEQVQQADIVSRLNPDDDHENEIDDPGRESEKVTTMSTVDGESTDSEKVEDQTMDERIDEEAAESESITETAQTEAPIHHELKSLDSTEIDDSNDLQTDFTTAPPEVLTTGTPVISHRKPKMLNNIIMVYPNEMSGIPKTTPKNMPETNEMEMYDEDMGMNLHLVFSKTTSETNIELETTTAADVDYTTKQSQHNFANRKKRRKYRRRTTETPNQDEAIKSTTLITPTTYRPLNRFTGFQKRRKLNPQESNDSRITIKSTTSRATTETPIAQEEEILHTSEDDKTHQNRFRLYSARHRLNYLRRSTTSTTTELPMEESSNDSNVSKHVDSSKRGFNKMNETLIRNVDTSHRNMMKKVRVALMAAASTNQITEVPRSFGSADMDKRVRKVEKMLAGEITNAYNEMKSRRRGSRPNNQESKNVGHINQQDTTTELPIKKPTTNTTQPYRGTKKFELSDLFAVTNSNVARRTRTRSTTVRPVTVTEEITATNAPKTRGRGRRPSTTVPPTPIDQINENKRTEINESTTPKKNRERYFRRRVKISRKTAIENASATTIPPLFGTTTPIISAATSTTIQATPQTTPQNTPLTTHPTTPPSTPPTTLPTLPTTTQETTEDTPTTTQPSEEVEESNVVTQSKDEITEIAEIVTNPTEKDPDTDAVSIRSEFKPSPLWQIKTDDPNDFIEFDENYSNSKSSRQSRNIFQPPSEYIHGFVPIVEYGRALPIIGPIPKPNIFADDTRVRYSLPTDDKVNQFI